LIFGGGGKLKKISWTVVEVGLLPGGVNIYGLDELKHLKERYVYAIEMPKDVVIEYDNGMSRVCYIGRQGSRVRGDRVSAHAKSWIHRSLVLTQSKYPYKVHYAHPRQQGFAKAFADIEAFMLREFHEKFGRKPLFNKRNERELGKYPVDLNAKFFRGRSKSSATIINGRTQIDDEVL
jgi:hypothetical protein